MVIKMKTNIILIPLFILAVTSILVFLKTDINKKDRLTRINMSVSGFVVSCIMLLVIYILNR